MSNVAELADQIVLGPAQLLAALAEHERRAAVLALATRRLETTQQWAADGSASMVAWLRHHARMSDRAAAQLVRHGRFLDRFCAVADAAVSGALSAGQLVALQAVVKPALHPILAEHQGELIGTLAALSVSDTEKACVVWRQLAEALVEEGAPAQEPERNLAMSRAGDGALVGRFVLDEAAATEFEKAIRNATTWEGSGDARTGGRRAADALFDIAAHFNKTHLAAAAPRNLPNVTISVDASTLHDQPIAVNEDNERVLTAACADTYLCDCVVHAVARDATGVPLSFGRGRYTVPRALFRQLAARDGGCRFPGCNRSVRFTEAHHIRFWRNGGATEYDNLVLLCSRHHHLVHQTGLELKLLPNGAVRATWRDGRHRSSQPRGAPPKRPAG